jgi:hypothetical protein
MRALGAIVRTRKRIVLLTVLAVVLAGLFVVWISRPTLDEFVGRDLRKLDEEPQPAWKELLGKIVPAKYINPKARLHRWLDSFLPEKQTSTQIVFVYRPWHLWRYKEDSEPRFVLLLVQPLVMVPGASRAAIHLLSSTGKHLGGSDFSTGGRRDVMDVSFRFEPLVNDRIIEIQTSWFGRRPADTRLIYGILENRVALIRVEDKDGKVKPNFHCGPDPPKRTVEEWETILASSEPAHVLEALTWIGGFDGSATRLNSHFRGRTSLRDKVTGLCVSENRWIREAAIAALEKSN